MRESLIVVIVGLMVPWFVFILGKDDFRPDIKELVSMVVPVCVGVWASAKAGSWRAKGGRSRVILPITSVTDWASSFLVPTIIAGLLGLMLGYWGSLLYGTGYQVAAMHQDIHANMWMGALYLASGFELCYIAATAFSPFAAVILGVAWVLPGLMLMDIYMGYALGRSAILLSFLIRTAAGGLVASMLIRVMASRTSAVAGQTAVLVLVLAIPGWSLYTGLQQYAQRDRTERYGGSGFVFPHYDSGSITLRSFLEGRRGAVLPLRFTDLRTGYSRTRFFEQAFQIIGVAGRRDVYLMHQGPHDDSVQVIAWDTRDDSVRDVMQVPLGRDALIRWNGIPNALSPDGRYALVSRWLDSSNAQDLWALDLARKRSALVLPNYDYQLGERRFSGSEAWLCGGPDTIVIDLDRMRARPVTVPGPKGG